MGGSDAARILGPNSCCELSEHRIIFLTVKPIALEVKIVLAVIDQGRLCVELPAGKSKGKWRGMDPSLIVFLMLLNFYTRSQAAWDQIPDKFLPSIWADRNTLILDYTVSADAIADFRRKFEKWEWLLNNQSGFLSWHGLWVTALSGFIPKVEESVRALTKS